MNNKYISLTDDKGNELSFESFSASSVSGIKNGVERFLNNKVISSVLDISWMANQSTFGAIVTYYKIKK